MSSRADPRYRKNRFETISRGLKRFFHEKIVSTQAQEAKENRFTLAMNMPPAAEGARIGKRGRIDPKTAGSLLATPLGSLFGRPSNPDALTSELARVFGSEWNLDAVAVLQSNMLLEAHRRALRLERLVCADDDEMKTMRSRAFARHKYLVIDPLTLGVPIAVGYMAEEGFNLPKCAEYRVHSIVTAIRPIFQYGMLLTKRARSTPGAPQNFLFDGEWMPRLLADCMHGEGEGVAAEKRLRNERHNERECVVRGIPTNSDLLARYRLMIRRALVLLPEDTLELSFTRFLPPTQSMPEASYDPDAFCRQIVVSA